METTIVTNKIFDNEVLEDIQGIINGSLDKNLILCTKNQVYYAVDGYKTKNLVEILRHNGIEYRDRISVTGDSNRGYSSFSKFYFEPNNKYFYKVDFDICCRPSGVWFAKMLKICAAQILKIYPSKNFQTIRNLNDEKLLSQFELLTNNDSSFILHGRKEISGYTYAWNDIQTKNILPWGFTYDLHKDTIEKLKTFFKENGYDIDTADFPTTTYNLIAFLKKAGLNSANKALQTRINLIKEVFNPMYEAAKEKLQDKLYAKALGAQEWAKENNNEQRFNDKAVRPFIMRHNEWLYFTKDLFKDYCGKAIIYNVIKKTRYIVTLSKTKGIESICIFNMENIDVFTKKRYTYSCEAVIWGKSSDWKTFPFDDVQYIDTMKMYDIQGNEIDYKECFAGTKIPEIIETLKDRIYAPIFKTYEKDRKNLILEKIGEIDYSNNKIEKLIEINRIPKNFFLMLCLKDDYRIATEQLAKCGYLNILDLMVTDQNSFKSSAKGPWDHIIYFDKTKTNIKNCFSLSTNQLKAMDEWLETNVPNNLQAVNFLDMLFGKEKAKMIDKETFIGFIDFFDKTNTNLSTIANLKESAEEFGISNLLKNPKETLNLFEKIKNISTWYDYLRMRQQLNLLVQRGSLQVNMKNYKPVPDKSTRFVTLRTTTRHLSSGYRYASSAHVQLEQYKHWYKNLTVLSRTEARINVLLNMDISEHIRFLHDELSELVAVFRDEQRDVLFTEAAKRVEKYEWENDKIIIMAPKNPSEIVNEAHALSHCVASFIDPIIDGTENVMFIRKKNIPDCSWYTMAIDNCGNVEQIHNYRNGNLSTLSQANAYETCGLPSYREQIELVPILKKWAKEKGINIDSIRESYGALGARR